MLSPLKGSNFKKLLESFGDEMKDVYPLLFVIDTVDQEVRVTSVGIIKNSKGEYLERIILFTEDNVKDLGMTVEGISSDVSTLIDVNNEQFPGIDQWPVYVSFNYSVGDNEVYGVFQNDDQLVILAGGYLY